METEDVARRLWRDTQIRPPVSRDRDYRISVRIGKVRLSRPIMSLSRGSHALFRTATTEARSWPMGLHKMTQDGPVAVLAACFVERICASTVGRYAFIISCCKEKRDCQTQASDLYISPLFKKSIVLARRLEARVKILSAKYGLMSEDLIVEPYDLVIAELDEDASKVWGDNLSSAISEIGPEIDDIYLLSGKMYSEVFIKNALDSKRVHEPLKGLSIGNRLKFLNICLRILDRKLAIRRIYEHLAVRAGNGLRTLTQVLSDDVPKRGVYFFFDPAEKTDYSDVLPRLVRIGTHGVSKGSRSSLRMRLRTHYGANHGGGNHRGSIFRLHVGMSIIRRDGLEERFPSWGVGQSANASISEMEKELESQVSIYISRLFVLFIEIGDEPGKNSLRAIVEKNLIALFTEAHLGLERAGDHWLGRWSPHDKIRQSGLWNVRGIGDMCDLKVVDFICKMGAATHN